MLEEGLPKVLGSGCGMISGDMMLIHARIILQVVVYTEPDALSLHVLEAEEKVCLGASTREYTNAAKLLEAAVSTG
jgi:biotin carboxylase